MTDRLSHVGPDGEARMVDVSSKPVTVRAARAAGSIRMAAATLDAIEAHSLRKGDVLAVARVAGIMGAKRTAELIPLCHPLPLDDVQVTLTPDRSLPGIRAQATARTTGRTGVEMEAIVAASIALLTVYDMAKAIDRGMTIGEVMLLEKTGGQRGDWSRG
ncbi:MAG: cyclic pyranopterin monophosphate synthase MoaC [Gemmatimonadaceae bacterium]|nr:cyclic pyranopterin monophosphate synthase MoaC [Gemmatimonadaceae bacterium]